MDLLYGAKNGVHAFCHNFAESEPIIWNLEHSEYIAGAGPGTF